MPDETQGEALKRVSTRIAPAVRSFCGSVLDTTLKRFHAGDLHDYVMRATGIMAPASADRVLRDQRQKGEVNYRVLSRRESLYEVLSMRNRTAKNGNGKN